MGKRAGPVKEPPSDDRAPEGRPANPSVMSEPHGLGVRPTAEPSLDEGGTSTADIREGIEQTRSAMGGTLGALQEKLSPSNVKDQVKESVQEHIEDAKRAIRAATVGKVETMIRDTGNTLSEARQTFWDTVRENPVPAALSAIGLTWLFLNRGGRGHTGRTPRFEGRQAGFQDERYGSGFASNGGERFEEGSTGAVQRLKEGAVEAAEVAQRKVGDIASTASEAAGRVADQAQVQARRVEQAFGRWMRQNPVAIGAVALAAGTAVGLALPRTDKEDQLLGHARDSMVDRAQQMASQAVGEVREHLTESQPQPH